MFFEPGWSMPARSGTPRSSILPGTIMWSRWIHGRKATPTNLGNSPESRARNIQELVDHLKLAPVVLVGWSLGSARTVELCRAIRRRPGARVRCSSMASLGTNWTRSSSPPCSACSSGAVKITPTRLPGATRAMRIAVSFKAMHELNYFREHLEVFAEMAKKRGAALDLEAFRKLDKERRELITATEHEKAQEYWTSGWPRKSPAPDSPSTRAGERGWSARSQIFSSMCTPASTATRKSCRPSW